MNASARKWFLLLGAVLVVHASEDAKKEKGNSNWVHSKKTYNLSDLKKQFLHSLI